MYNLKTKDMQKIEKMNIEPMYQGILQTGNIQYTESGLYIHRFPTENSIYVVYHDPPKRSFKYETNKTNATH